MKESKISFKDCDSSLRSQSYPISQCAGNHSVSPAWEHIDVDRMNGVQCLSPVQSVAIELVYTTM